MPPKGWDRTKTKTADNAPSTVAAFIVTEIKKNNCLALPEEEIVAMASELAKCKTRAEVHEWGSTLMLGEEFATAVIQKREQLGPAFDGESLPGSAGKDKSSAKNLRVGKNKKRVVDVNALQKSSTGDPSAVKPGLFECGCFATVHNLKANCANCGRIICEQESDETCYSCGLDPSTCLAYEIAVQEGNINEAALGEDKASYDAAIARRDKLLGFAENRAKRTTVIDDQSATLFASKDAWVSAQERKQQEVKAATDGRQRLIQAMHHTSGAVQLHSNFVSENVPLGALERDAGAAPQPAADDAEEEENEASASESSDESVGPSGAEPLPSLLKKIWYSPDGSKVENATTTAATPSEAPKPTKVHPYHEVSRRVQQNYFEEDAEIFEEVLSAKTGAELIFNPAKLADEEEEKVEEEEEVAEEKSGLTVIRNLQDYAKRFAPTPLMRMKDEGVCLSMHQPWASLLVAGIKTHEGRVWGTDYRGKLWIHAASVQPVNVEEVEQHAAQFVPPGTPFPKFYPTRVLWGMCT
ncbi:activating signal cointegrator 1 [Angomonas deanei]|nr:activating signal cointegrator 1 [Angomonas deanei]|eukprot:EPY32349.1 activating signal cointegrator 1 [Angomonas deanei]